MPIAAKKHARPRTEHVRFPVIIAFTKTDSSTMKPRMAVRSRKANASAADFIPPSPTLPKMRAAVQDCRGCGLYKLATQAVFGEGPRSAHVMFVGEQPGDAEDKAGRPFVGPAGRLLDRALDAAGIDRDDVYVTNAVKHFKWAKDARSKRRIHKTPSVGEVSACRPWLEAEVALVRPTVIVCLGATAAKSMLGRTFSVLKRRGIAIESEWAPAVFATVHPSAVLRAPEDQRRIAERLFIGDIRKVARFLKQAGNGKRTGRPARKLSAWPITADRSDISRTSTRSSRE
jgi:uracil-DNA glycosylase family protein